MLKRINWSAILTGFAWLISLAGVVVLLSFINVKKQTVKCTNVKILIPGADNFIEREEVDAILRQDQGVLLGRNLEQINIHQIEKKLRSNPYIGFAKVYADMDGVIRIEIKQRQPILRIINSNGQDFYIDNEGLKMPISSNFTANVLVATGNIDEAFANRVDTLQTQLVKDLYKTALYIDRDTLWENQIVQIGVDAKKDIVMIPRVGDEKILLGSADSLDVKMKNLKIFYKKVMPQIIAKAYKTINIKYTNQVVCEKLKSDSSSSFKRTKVLTVKDSVAIRNRVTDSLVSSMISKSIKEEKKEPAKPKPEIKVVKPPVVAPVKPVVVPKKVAEEKKATVDKKSTTDKNKKK
jgi:cell division protein FtsQ